MYAYGKVIIERPDIWTLPVSAISNDGEDSFYWRSEKDGEDKERAMRTAVQTGVTDGTWIEVTGYRHSATDNGQDAWTPLNGSEPVIVADDVSESLTDGQHLRFRSVTDEVNHKEPR